METGLHKDHPAVGPGAPEELPPEADFEAMRAVVEEALRSMSPEALLKAITKNEGYLPVMPLEIISSRREAFIPGLIALVEDVVANTAARIEDEEHVGHLIALYLLAEFRCEAATPAFLDFLRLPEEQQEMLTDGEFIWSDLPGVIRSFSGDRLALIEDILRDPACGEIAKNSALEALPTMVYEHPGLRDPAIALLKEQLSAATDDGTLTPGMAVMAAMDLTAAQLLEDIRAAYEREAVDEGVVTLQEVEECFRKGKLWDGFRPVPLVQAIDDLSRLGCFETALDDEPEEEDEAEFDDGPYDDEITMPVRLEQPKTGRNAPCPCGSGKKHKRCCG